jgi:hypothetical protein
MLAPCPATVQFVSIIQLDTELVFNVSVAANATDTLALVIEDAVANERSWPVILLDSQSMLVSKDRWNVSAEKSVSH